MLFEINVNFKAPKRFTQGKLSAPLGECSCDYDLPLMLCPPPPPQTPAPLAHRSKSLRSSRYPSTVPVHVSLQYSSQ